METRRLGRLGHRSSVLIYGAAALGDVSQDVADASIALALEAGINHIDVAPSYGEAELRLGAMMGGIRPRIFLATKTLEREREGAAREIERSLERLRTDRIDLIQFHSVGEPALLDRITAPGGALEAAIAAREQGIVGGVGITGHGHGAPAVHLEALRRFPFDTVLTPLNPAMYREPDFRRDFDALAREIVRQDAALMTIKTGALRPWRSDEARQFATWYAPLDQQAQVTAAVAFALARSEVTGIATAGDVNLLPLFIQAERDWASLAPEEAERLLLAAEEYASPFAAGLP